jgi:hypothetical protein
VGFLLDKSHPNVVIALAIASIYQPEDKPLGFAALAFQIIISVFLLIGWALIIYFSTTKIDRQNNRASTELSIIAILLLLVAIGNILCGDSFG